MIPHVRVRFAPSPTGPLHVGGARTALFNFLFARQNGGAFILRIDDTDTERSEAAFEREILDGLRWLGLNWDEGPEFGGSRGPYRQSERRARHLEAVERLLSKKSAFYDAGGAVRLRYAERSEKTVIDDLVCGRCEFTIQSLGPEPVLLRSDGNPTYHLASVVDDIDMEISHVIRGQDHLTNTAKHALLFRALGAPCPVFAHLPLLLGMDGSKLSKRAETELTLVSEFRRAGIVREALVNFLMLLGWSHPEGRECLSLEEGIRSFSLERVRRTGAIFDPQKLRWLNIWWLKHLELAELVSVGEEFLGAYRDAMCRRGRRYLEAFFATVREEMRVLADAEALARLCVDPFPEPSPTALELFRAAPSSETLKEVAQVWEELLANTPTEDGSDTYSAEQFVQMVSLLKKRFRSDSKSLLRALRFLVTGQITGVELKHLVPLIPREMLVERASGYLNVVYGSCEG